jgi:hypothetical protein
VLPFALEYPLELGDHVGILTLEELCSLRDDGHAASEAPIRLGELDADESTTEDDEMLGQPVDLEELDVREWSDIRQAGDRRHRGMRPHIEKHPLARHRTSAAVVQIHPERLPPDEARRPMISSAPLAR